MHGGTEIRRNGLRKSKSGVRTCVDGGVDDSTTAQTRDKKRKKDMKGGMGKRCEDRHDDDGYAMCVLQQVLITPPAHRHVNLNHLIRIPTNRDRGRRARDGLSPDKPPPDGHITAVERRKASCERH